MIKPGKSEYPQKGPAFLPRTQKFVVFFLFLSSLALVLASCAPPQIIVPQTAAQAQQPSGELASVLENGIIVVASDPDYPPQSHYDSSTLRQSNTRCSPTQYTANQWSGFDVDVAKEIAHRMGVEPCFVAPAWSQIIAGDWNDRWDIDVGSMVITHDRMSRLYFTQPYISGEAVIFVNRDNQTYHHLADLSGKRIGVCSGCAYESYLHDTLIIPGATINFVIQNATAVGYDTDTSALADLALGDGIRLDAVMTDPDTGKAAIAKGLPIKQLPDVVYHDYSAVAVDKKSSRDPLPLLNKLTEIIQAMHSDGTLLKLSHQYYDGDFTTPAAKFDFKALDQTP